MQGLPSNSVSIVLCTAPRTASSEIANNLVQSHLVACVNIMPVRSVYWWEGAVCDDDEDLLIMKTSTELVDILTGRILSLHPYEVPEVIHHPIQGGSARYLEWVLQSVQNPSLP